MTLQWTPFTLPLILSAAISAAVAGLAWRRRETPGATPLALMMVGLTVWTVGETANLTATTLPAKTFWTRVEILCSATIPLGTVLFVLEYTGRTEAPSWRVLAALAVEPLLLLLVVATAQTGVHDLLRRSVGLTTADGVVYITETLGPLFWAHALYSYLLILGGLLVLLSVSLTSDRFYRRQSLAVFGALAIVFVANAAYVVGITPAGFDPTNLAFTVAGGLLLVAISRRRLLDLVPVAREVARDETIENMTDGVVVLDAERRVVDLNPAAVDIFGIDGSVVGEPATSVHPGVGEIVDREAVADGGRTELTVRDGAGHRHYEVRVSPLRGGYGAVSGSIVTLQDVTRRRRREQRLAVQNRLLRHNVRNELNVVTGYVDLAAEAVDDDEVRERLATASTTADTVVERCEKLGRVGDGAVAPQPVEVTGVVAAVVEEARADLGGAGGRVVVGEIPDAAWVRSDPSLRAAVAELVANALEHAGDEPEVRTSVRRRGDRVRIDVTDDGPGVPVSEAGVIRQGTETPLRHSSGVGLWVVRWVVERNGGEIRFDTDPPSDADANTVSLLLPATDPPDAES